jgi:hypothetical protein
MSTGQSHSHSLLESIINVLIGYTIAIISQTLIFPLYDIHITILQNMQMGLWFTIISIIRSYYLRRWFNRITIRSK